MPLLERDEKSLYIEIFPTMGKVGSCCAIALLSPATLMLYPAVWMLVDDGLKGLPLSLIALAVGCLAGWGCYSALVELCTPRRRILRRFYPESNEVVIETFRGVNLVETERHPFTEKTQIAISSRKGAVTENTVYDIAMKNPGQPSLPLGTQIQQSDADEFRAEILRLYGRADA